MPREQKLGFTILIMIVGFAGAFCFRKPSPDQPAPPELQRELSINDQIAELPMRPQLPGASGQQAEMGDAARNPLEEELTYWTSAGENSGKQEVPPPIGRLLPMEESSETQEDARTTAERNSSSPPQQENSGDDSRDSRSSSVADRNGAIHIVEPGETLSGIAYEHFGAASRYRDIYQANRDQLSSPNDLRPGLKLKIPHGNPEIQKAETNETEPDSRNARNGLPEDEWLQ